MEKIEEREVFDFLPGTGGMAERIRNFDWSTRPLGEPDQWSQTLKSVLSLMLYSDLKML